MQTLTLPGWQAETYALGNIKIAAETKTAFLCSRKYPAGQVLKIYDWARDMRDKNKCVLSGFHSALERDVLEILLDGEQPIIIACARALPKRPPKPIKTAIEKNRLLLLSPFADTSRINQKSANTRNQFMLAIADQIVIGHQTANGNLAAALRDIDAAKVVWL